MHLRDENIPFSCVLRTWLRQTAGIDGTVGDLNLMTAPAWQNLERALLARLADLATPTLLSLFDARRTLPPAARMTLLTPVTAPRAAYNRFVADLESQGLDTALAHWPVLLQRLRQQVHDGHHAVSDFINHLRTDRHHLARLVPNWADAVPAVADVRFGLSDPHGGGRSVARVQFADGQVLAYKPRSLAVDAAFADLLRHLSGIAGVPNQRVALTVDRGDHGWMEWIDPAPMHGPGDVTKFYQRCGGLLAVITALRGGDIHPDNLVAAGAFPVILDLECLFQPGPADLGREDPLLDPVAFQAGLLPAFTSFDGGRTLVPVAAAGAGPISNRPQRRVVHSGTDWMHEAEWPVPSFDALGPTLLGQPLDVRDHADALAHGFHRTLTALARRRQVWERPGGPLHRLSRAPVRFLAAPTNLYALVLERGRQPSVLEKDAALDGLLTWVSGRFPPLRSHANWSRIRDAEQSALRRLDVPAFRYRPTGSALREAGGRPAGRLPGPAIAGRAAADMAGLTPAGIRDLTAQITACLRRPAGPCDTPTIVSPRHVLAALADRIAGLAIPVQGGVTWVRMWEQMPAPVAPAGPGLCYGAGGIALALATAAQTLNSDHLADLARLSLRPWTGPSRVMAPEHLARHIGPGWGYGLGGLIAALVWCAEHLEQPALLEEARTLAMASRSALHVNTGVPDLLKGAAGLLLGLSVLHHRQPDKAVLSAMRSCGRIILRRSRLSGGGRDWPDRGRTGLAGLSHGAGGIAVALAHLAAIEGQRGPWRDAVHQALAYEDSLFVPDQGNWRTPGGQPPFKSTWCHGAPGIALARLAIKDLLPDMLGPVEIAVNTTAAREITDIDDLCCGEAGRLDILLTLASRTGDLSLKATADAALAARLPDWAAGRFRLMSVQAGAPDDPSLFRGLGGLMHLLIHHLAPGNVATPLLPLMPAAGR